MKFRTVLMFMLVTLNALCCAAITVTVLTGNTIELPRGSLVVLMLAMILNFIIASTKILDKEVNS